MATKRKCKKGNLKVPVPTPTGGTRRCKKKRSGRRRTRNSGGSSPRGPSRPIRPSRPRGRRGPSRPRGRRGPSRPRGPRGSSRPRGRRGPGGGPRGPGGGGGGSSFLSILGPSSPSSPSSPSRGGGNMCRARRHTLTSCSGMSPAERRVSYKRQSMQVHPDRQGNRNCREYATEKFQRLKKMCG